MGVDEPSPQWMTDAIARGSTSRTWTSVNVSTRIGLVSGRPASSANVNAREKAPPGGGASATLTVAVRLSHEPPGDSVAYSIA